MNGQRIIIGKGKIEWTFGIVEGSGIGSSSKKQ